jgi:hypothetical protein
MPINLDGMDFPGGKPPASPNFGKPPTPPTAPAGRAGDAGWWIGGDGSTGFDGIHATFRRPGAFGVTGGPGGDAYNATIAVFNLNVDPSISDWIHARGGKGGDGGDATTPGGDGGAGGAGGPGWALGGGGKGGDGGMGGNGAAAGNGGIGGKGGRIEINYSGFVVWGPVMVKGGSGGLPGTGGPAGNGGPGGLGAGSIYGPGIDGASGAPGDNGRGSNDGLPGRTGDSGQIWINGIRKV